MKKLKLLPKTDTVTICLPREWVGCAITCTLSVQKEKVHCLRVQEEAIRYRINHHKRKAEKDQQISAT